MAEDTVCTIGVYGGRQPSILVNNHPVYGRIPDPGTQPDIIADVPKNRLVANLNPASDGMTDNPRLPLEMFAAWLANGDVGFSSLAIVQRLTGITMTVNGTREHGCEDTPKDPGDLRRILGMFDINKRGAHSDRPTRRRIVGITIKAWNKWREGATVKLLKFSPNEQFPDAI